MAPIFATSAVDVEVSIDGWEEKRGCEGCEATSIFFPTFGAVEPAPRWLLYSQISR